MKSNYKKIIGDISIKDCMDLIELYLESLDINLNKVLLIPPDGTRIFSGMGLLTEKFYERYKEDFEVCIMPALGTHKPMNANELKNMFGEDIPPESFIVHDWKNDTEFIGSVPPDLVEELSNGALTEKIEVEINKHILSDEYDLILSLGQIIPHEVVGISNYTKNIVVGAGSRDIINKSHFIGAVHGIENVLGKIDTPPRKLFNYIQAEIINDLPIHYVFSVNKSKIQKNGYADILGLFVGQGYEMFKDAAELSQKNNITQIDELVDKFVVYLDPEEFKSTWVGCKAIYRTRMAISNGGELIIIAPGVNTFGEDDHFDELIRKYGYQGKDKVIELVDENKELKDDLAVPAHLIHGSTEGKFEVYYATDKLSKEEIESVNFNYKSLDDVLSKYKPENLTEGFNKIDDELFYYIENPATGLWQSKSKG